MFRPAEIFNKEKYRIEMKKVEVLKKQLEEMLEANKIKPNSYNNEEVDKIKSEVWSIEISNKDKRYLKYRGLWFWHYEHRNEDISLAPIESKIINIIYERSGLFGPEISLEVIKDLLDEKIELCFDWNNAGNFELFKSEMKKYLESSLPEFNIESRTDQYHDNLFYIKFDLSKLNELAKSLENKPKKELRLDVISHKSRGPRITCYN